MCREVCREKFGLPPVVVVEQGEDRGLRIGNSQVAGTCQAEIDFVVLETEAFVI
jgi:hypothetical protein